MFYIVILILLLSLAYHFFQSLRYVEIDGEDDSVVGMAIFLFSIAIFVWVVIWLVSSHLVYSNSSIKSVITHQGEILPIGKNDSDSYYYLGTKGKNKILYKESIEGEEEIYEIERGNVYIEESDSDKHEIKIYKEKLDSSHTLFGMFTPWYETKYIFVVPENSINEEYKIQN